VLLAAFVTAESRAGAPLLPLAMFRRRNLRAAIVVSALAWGAFFATIYESTLFMQEVLHASAIHTGVAWLAATASSLVVAGAVAPRLVGRIGPARSLAIGQVVMGVGLFSLTTAPVDAAYWSDLFPGFLALGVGMGLTVVGLQVAAFTGVPESVSGLAGGMIETSREVGGAVGVAVVSTLAIARADRVLAGRGSDTAAAAVAATEGYQRAMLAAALLSFAAAVTAGVLLRRAERPVGAPEPNVPSASVVESATVGE
jgi:MFS family permease